MQGFGESLAGIFRVESEALRRCGIKAHSEQVGALQHADFSAAAYVIVVHFRADEEFGEVAHYEVGLLDGTLSGEVFQ